MNMPGRKYSAGTSYRYGFNGKENDNEVKGEGNQQDYGMRVYDPRLGRFLSVDPLIDKYPELSSYQYANNSPIANIDLDGQEDYYYKLQFDSKTGLSQLTFNEKRDVGLWGIGNIFASDCILEYPISIGGKEYVAEYYLTGGSTQPSQAALKTYNGKTKAEIAKIMASTPTKWGTFAEGLKKDADDTEQRIGEGFVIGSAIQRVNTITKQQQTSANNKTTTDGQKNTTNNTETQNAGGKNNQTSSQKAGALTGTGAAGNKATPITYTNATSSQVKSFISTEEQAQSLTKVASIQKALNSADPFVFAQPIYTTVYKGKTYILDGHNRLKAVATNTNSATTAPIQELSNEKAREMYKPKMEQIEAGKFSKKIGEDN